MLGKRQKEVNTESNIRTYGMFQNFIYALKKAAKYHKSYVAALIFGSVSYAAFNLLSIYMPKIIIDMIEKQVTIKELLIVTGFLGLSLLVLNCVVEYANYIRDWGFAFIQERLANEIMEKSFSTDFANLENPKFLDYIHRAQKATWHRIGFHSAYNRFYFIFSQGITIIISAVAILVLNPYIVIAIFILSYFTYRIFDKTTKEDKVEHSDKMASTNRKLKYMSMTTRNFDYAKDIRLFSMGKWFERIWKGLNKTKIQNEKEHHLRWIVCDGKMNLMVLIESIILYAWLIYMVLFKNMTIGNFTLYVGLVNALSASITDFFGNFTYLTRSKLEINDYRTVLEWEDKKIKEIDTYCSSEDLKCKEYEFRFENVSFKYPGHDKYVLKNVNLTITPKMKLAIVGVNGAGKTTFTKLLMKLYEPTEGRILLNGVDIRNYNKDDYYKIFSPVFQNIECFPFPIWENISFNYEDETDINKVWECVNTSGLGDKINLFPKGINTELLKIFYEDGVDLSGGEKQRLAMARALYKGGSVIVLDEPTAALDALAEDKMYREFNKMVENKTSVFISHRLSSTRFCDKIAMFNNGMIVELGNHEELMAKNGKYAKMYNIQAQYYREETKNKNTGDCTGGVLYEDV